MTIVDETNDGVKCEEFAEVIKIDEGKVRRHVEEVVRQSVEETLNGLLEAEADELCGAKRYERNVERLDTRAGHYERKLQTKAGEVNLKVPRLRSMPFETEIVERYRRRESSIEEAMIEMYLAGVSVRRVEDITEALWGTRVSPSTVSEPNQKIYVHIDAWRSRPIEGEHPYVFLDGIWLKRAWGGEVENVAVLVAIAVGGDAREPPATASASSVTSRHIHAVEVPDGPSDVWRRSIRKRFTRLAPAPACLLIGRPISVHCHVAWGLSRFRYFGVPKCT